jgi:prevent-host-death family protein
MKASILDLRRRMRDVLDALERNEPVTILHRGVEKGVIVSTASTHSRAEIVSDHPAFGIWKDREDFGDVAQAVRQLRKGRYNAI